MRLKKISRVWIVTCLMLLLVSPLTMPAFGASTAVPAPQVKFTAIDSNGDPYVGAFLYTYETGTSTPKTTWTDSTKGTPNSNPIILDSKGQADVWIDSISGAYRFKLKNADGVTLWTKDGITGSEDWSVAPDLHNPDKDDKFILYDTSGGVLSRLPLSDLNGNIYYPDYNEADQGVTGSGNTFKSAVDSIGSDSGTIVLRHNSGGATTVYVFSTNLDVSSYTNITIKVENGAILSPAAGVTLTIGSLPFEAGLYQVFSGSGNISLSGTIYPNWWDSNIGDGSTVANTIFDKAIAAATAGSEIIIPPATSYYNCTSYFTIDKALYFHGLERNSADIRQATSDTNLLRITADNVEVGYLKLTGPQYTASQSNEIGISAYGTDKDNYISDIYVHDCVVQEFGGSGIQMSFVEDFVIENNKVLNLHTHGIITRSANYGKILNNKVNGVVGHVGSTTVYGITLTVSGEDDPSYPVSSYIQVTGNTVDGCAHEAIGSHYGNHLLFDHNTVLNSVYGIAVQSSAVNDSASNIIISNNILERGTDYSATEVGTGIMLTGTVGQPGYNCVISGNSLNGFGRQNGAVANSPSAAMEIREQLGCTVANNNIYDSGRHGILYRGVVDLNASGNVIKGISGTGGVKATGTITFAANPSNGDTITINGAVYTFVDPAAPATDYEIDIKASLPLTLDEMVAVLNAANGQVDAYPTDGRVSTSTYTEDGVDTLTITYDYPGRNGNYVTLAASAATVSGGTLSGGDVGSAAIAFDRLSLGADTTGLIHDEVITIGSDYTGFITEPAIDIVGLHIENVLISGAGCDYDLKGSSGDSNSAIVNISPFKRRVTVTYDLPSIAAGSIYTFNVPLDGIHSTYTKCDIYASRTFQYALTYSTRPMTNYIQVCVINSTAGAINAISQKISLTVHMR